MEKIIKIGNREILFRATAATPLHYRNTFKGHDIMRELAQLKDEKDLESKMDFGVLERMAYIMSGAFKEGVSLVDWLEQFEVMDLLHATSEIIELYTDSENSQSIVRKNQKAEETES